MPNPNLPLFQLLTLGFHFYGVPNTLVRNTLGRMMADAETEDPMMKWEDVVSEEDQPWEYEEWLEYGQQHGLELNVATPRSKRADVAMTWDLHVTVENIVVTAEAVDMPPRIIEQLAALEGTQLAPKAPVRQPIRRLEHNLRRAIEIRYDATGMAAFDLGTRHCWLAAQFTLLETAVCFGIPETGEYFGKEDLEQTIRFPGTVQDIEALNGYFDLLASVRQLPDWQELMKWRSFMDELDQPKFDPEGITEAREAARNVFEQTCIILKNAGQVATGGTVDSDQRNRAQIALSSQHTGASEDYYSVFISYGGPDEHIARRIHGILQANGVETFFFPVSAQPGRRLHRTMADGVREFDRVLLLCSKNSLDRPGVMNEIEQVLVREADEGGTELIVPIAIDDYVFERWRPERPDLADQIRSRVVADLPVNAEDNKFEEHFERILTAIRK